MGAHQYDVHHGPPEELIKPEFLSTSLLEQGLDDVLEMTFTVAIRDCSADMHTAIHVNLAPLDADGEVPFVTDENKEAYVHAITGFMLGCAQCSSNHIFIVVTRALCFIAQVLDRVAEALPNHELCATSRCV